MRDGEKPSVGGATVDGLHDKLRAEFSGSQRVPAPESPSFIESSTSKPELQAQQLMRLKLTANDKPVGEPETASEVRGAENTGESGAKPTETPETKLFSRAPKGEDGSVDHTSAPRLPPSIYVGSLIINLLALALPVVILQVYDRILPNQATATLTMLVIGLIGVLVLDTAMKIARAYMVGWVTAHHEYEISCDALDRMLYAPSSRIEKDAPSVHLDRLNAMDAMREFYGGQSRLLLLDMPFVVIFLGLMALIGGILVLVPIVLFAALGSVSVFRGRALRKILETRSHHDDRRYDFIIESLNGIETIKTMAMEPQIQRRFERLQKVGATASHQTILLGNSVQTIGVLFSNLTMISVVTVGAFMVIHGQLTMGTLAACTLLSGRTIQPLLKGLGLWTQMQRLAIARNQLDQLFTLEKVAHDPGTTAPELRGTISLSDVGFAYGPGEAMVLQNLNLEVAAGDMIGLRGGDGAGKSTLLKMICGEIEPTTGRLRLDGYEPSTLNPTWVSEWISRVPTHASIFRGTIMENLTMFRSGGAIDNAREAAQLIGLERDIHRLPSGYDMVLSEGISDELPAGMMQRIVIARALARKPRILLFDEGNSSLDAKSDMLLREGLEQLKGSTTIIIVSLRPSLLRLTDCVYSLLDGQLYDITSEYSDQAPLTQHKAEGA